MKISPLRTSAFRLALGYGVVFTLGVSVLLGAIYLLASGLLASELDAVITAELEGLTDEYRRSGLSGLTDELKWRADSWGRTGSVYLLVNSNLTKEGGNLTSWPFNRTALQGWAQFYIAARRGNDEFTRHPVRASVMLLPDGHRLLVGVDVNQQQQFRRTFRAATLWGIGLTALIGEIGRASCRERV